MYYVDELNDFIIEVSYFQSRYKTGACGLCEYKTQNKEIELLKKAFYNSNIIHLYPQNTYKIKGSYTYNLALLLHNNKLPNYQIHRFNTWLNYYTSITKGERMPEENKKQYLINMMNNINNLPPINIIKIQNYKIICGGMTRLACSWVTKKPIKTRIIHNIPVTNKKQFLQSIKYL